MFALRGTYSAIIVTRSRRNTGTAMNPFLQKLVETIGWSIIGVLLFLGSLWLFDRLDPTDYRREIQEGNIAAGIIVAAIILAISAIVVAILLSP